MSTNFARRVRTIVWGETDTRIRASWRVLLAVPLLWTLTGAVLAGNVQSTIEAIPTGEALGGGLAQSLLHGGFFILMLIVWARYFDHQPLGDYGVSATPRWALDFLAGFIAILLGFVFWIGVGLMLGSMTVVVAPSLPKDSILFGLVVPFVALVLHAAVQQIVFFSVILETATQGLHSRGINTVQAASGAVLVTILLFILMHGEVTVLRGLDLAVAGGIFALLYLHTDEVALGTGVHFGGFYSGIMLFSVIRTAGALPGSLGVINQYGFPKVVVAYVVLIAWLKWRQREPVLRKKQR